MPLLPQHLCLTAAQIERYCCHGVVLLPPLQPRKARQSYTRRTRHAQMQGGNPDIGRKRRKIVPPRGIAKQNSGQLRSHKCVEHLGQRQDGEWMLLRKAHVLPFGTPSEFLHVDVAFLRIHHREDAQPYRTCIVTGKCLQCRHADHGDVQCVRHHLCRRKADAQPREGPRPDTDGNAIEFRFLGTRHLQSQLDMRHECLGVRQCALHTHLSSDTLLREHRYARYLRGRIKAHDQQCVSTPPRAPCSFSPWRRR